MEAFNRYDEDLYAQLVSNAAAEQFLREQIPLIDCPDKDLEKTYYFRWWTYRKHIKDTEKGHIITEFLPPVPWSGPYNSINCPAGFHIREGRWLKDPGEWIKEYISFWLEGWGNLYSYSTWFAHAVLEYCTLKDDMAFGIEKLPLLIRYFETREKTNSRSGGVYWSNDDRDGMEYSISGEGLRPTINAYAYADAKAISQIAAAAGETEIRDLFAAKAEELKHLTDTLLWDGDFYKTIPLAREEDNPHTVRPQVDVDHDVRELVGYVPWYFCLPDAGKENAFRQLLDPDGFLAPHGITTAEQRHPRFMEEHSHMCLWNGPVWPFATSQVLVAMANLLHSYRQNAVSKEDYYRLLCQYARCHQLRRENGTVVPWIDENLHPFTGRWLARDILMQEAGDSQNTIYERGKDYNHSLFCDLVLSGLFGIKVENGTFAARPIVPDDWAYFRVDNLWLHGREFCIVYDKDGTHYGEKAGLYIQEKTQ